MSQERKQKIRYLYEEISNNEQDIDKISKIIVSPNSVTFNPISHEIVLLQNQSLFDFTGLLNDKVVEYTLNNFPEWAFPFVNVISTIYTDADYEIQKGFTIPATQTFTWLVTPTWVEIENGYKLIVFFAGDLDQLINGDIQELPLFFDLSLIITNKRAWNVIQHNKT